MVYCLNPDCSKPDNPDNNKICHGCHEDLDKSSKEYLFRGHYRIIKQLGEGGVGRTYLAEDIDCLNKLRVIKKFIYPVDAPNFEKAKELFKQEAEYLSELSHPQIPHLYGYFEHNHAFYLVQEFIEGKNLYDEVWEEGTFDEIQLRQLLKELLAVLVYLHEHNLVHGDIKPDNIMRRSYNKQSQLNEQSELVLINFGSSIKFDDNQKIIGSFGSHTRGYAAIEQIQGKATFASDVHCLGMTAVRLFTRCFREDFEDNKFNDWLYVDGELKWREYGEERGSKVSDELANILNKMLAPLVNNRYQSAQEVLDDLQTIIETVEPIASENNTENVSNIPRCKPTFVTPDIPPRRKRKKTKKTNKELSGNIAIIGPASGKTTYLATFGYFTNVVINTILESISPANDNSEYLAEQTEYILLSQSQFEPSRTQTTIAIIPFYYYTYSMKSRNLFNDNIKKIPVVFRDYSEYYFNVLSNNENANSKNLTDFIRDTTGINDKGILLLVDGNLPREDEQISNALKNLQPHILAEHQQRIALVFSMFETQKLQQYRKNVEKFAEIFFPQTVNALDDLIEYKNCDVAYFACSAFGFLEEDGKLVPNVDHIHYINHETLSHWGVIKDPKHWKPFGVVAPVYWLLTGEHDKRLLKT